MRGQHAPTILSAEEVRKVLDAPDKRTKMGIRDAAILNVLAYTGLRRNEVTALNVGSLTTYSGSPAIRYTPEKQRGHGVEKTIPFNGEVSEALNKWLKVSERNNLASLDKPLFVSLTHSRANGGGERLSGQTVNLIVQRYAKKAKLGVVPTAHSFRHAFATRLLDGGIDIKSISSALGHRSIQTTQRYVHPQKMLAIAAVDGY